MNDGQGNLAFYSAGYPLFLIPFLSVFGKAFETVQFTNVFLGAASTFLLYFCSKVILKSHIWSLLACLTWVCYPPNILYTEYLAKENLMVPLLLAQIFLVLTYNGEKAKAIALGVIFAMGMLVGSAIIFTVIPTIFVLLNIKKSLFKIQLKSATNVLVFFSAFTITLSPWLIYTKSQLGEAVISTNGGFNLYLGNNEHSTPYFISIMDTPIADKWHKLRKEQGELKAFNHLKTLALTHIFENPGSTIKLSIEKVIRFWTPPNHGGIGDISNSEKLVRLLWLLVYCAVLFLAFSSLLLFRKFTRAHLLLLSIILLYCLVHGAIYVIYRYRLPIMPIVIIFSMFALKESVGNLASNKK